MSNYIGSDIMSRYNPNQKLTRGYIVILISTLGSYGIIMQLYSEKKW